jgi:hypothetical protein
LLILRSATTGHIRETRRPCALLPAASAHSEGKHQVSTKPLAGLKVLGAPLPALEAHSRIARDKRVSFAELWRSQYRGAPS